LFIAFGFRPDLARIIAPDPMQALRSSAVDLGERQGNPLPRS